MMMDWTVCCRKAAEEEEPDSVTMGSVPEGYHSATPETRGRNGSFDAGTDIEMSRPSPTADVHEDMVEEPPTTEPRTQTSAADELNTTNDLGAASAVESSHSPRDGVHVNESTDHSESKRKKKKRRSTVADDDSEDVGHKAVKERSRHKHNDRTRGTGEKDETEKKREDVGLKVNDKNAVDDMSHSDHETKRKKSADRAKHRSVTDDRLTSETVNDKKKTKSKERSAFKSSADRSKPVAESGDGFATMVIRQYRHQDGIRERTYERTSASRKKRERKSVSCFN